MNEARRTALRECLIAVIGLTPVIWFLWAVDYVPGFRRFDPPTGLGVAFVTPFAYLLVRGVYRLVTGRVLNWPPKVDIGLSRRRR